MYTLPSRKSHVNTVKDVQVPIISTNLYNYKAGQRLSSIIRIRRYSVPMKM